MSQAAYIAVDWGTSSFRLWLMDRAGDVLAESRSQEGMMAAASGQTSLEEVLRVAWAPSEEEQP